MTNKEYYQEWLEDLERERDELQRLTDDEWNRFGDSRSRQEALQTTLADLRHVKSRLKEIQDEPS